MDFGCYCRGLGVGLRVAGFPEGEKKGSPVGVTIYCLGDVWGYTTAFGCDWEYKGC